jgi:hypothetical protein
MEDRHSTMPNYWLEMVSCDLFSLGWPQTMILPISNSKAARITGASQNSQFIHQFFGELIL